MQIDVWRLKILILKFLRALMHTTLDATIILVIHLIFKLPLDSYFTALSLYFGFQLISCRLAVSKERENLKNMEDNVRSPLFILAITHQNFSVFTRSVFLDKKKTLDAIEALKTLNIVRVDVKTTKGVEGEFEIKLVEGEKNNA